MNATSDEYEFEDTCNKKIPNLNVVIESQRESMMQGIDGRQLGSENVVWEFVGQDNKIEHSNAKLLELLPGMHIRTRGIDREHLHKISCFYNLAILENLHLLDLPQIY